MNYRDFSLHMRKQAATVMTPEAQAAAAQPPMDPAMTGGMPPQGAPMPPPGAPMDPSMAGAPMPPQGAPMPPQGQLPPEILQDQMFMQFMMQMGAQLDPNSGSFVGPDGQPIPPEMVMQAYQQFQQMMAQQGGAPQGAAPMDPAAGAMPPQGAPMDPSMAGAPAGAAPAIPDDIMNQISSAVMSGVESVLQDFSQQIGQVLKDLNDKLDRLGSDVSALSDIDDRRTADDRKAEQALRDELSADLNPTVPVEEPVKQASAKRALNIFDLINNRK